MKSSEISIKGRKPPETVQSLAQLRPSIITRPVSVDLKLPYPTPTAMLCCKSSILQRRWELSSWTISAPESPVLPVNFLFFSTCLILAMAFHASLLISCVPSEPYLRPLLLAWYSLKLTPCAEPLCQGLSSHGTGSYSSRFTSSAQRSCAEDLHAWTRLAQYQQLVWQHSSYLLTGPGPAQLRNCQILSVTLSLPLYLKTWLQCWQVPSKLMMLMKLLIIPP